MNTQLLLCIVIVLVFVVIMYSLCAPKPYVETFDGSKKYPDPLMSEHNKFLQTESNKDIKIIKTINTLSNDIYTESFNDSTVEFHRSELDKVKTKIRTDVLAVITQSLALDTLDTFEKTMYTEFKSYFEYIVNQNQSGLSHTHTRLKHVEIEVKNTDLITEMFVSNERQEFQFNNYTTFKQEKLYKRLLTKMLENIYYTINTKSNIHLACPLYTDNMCPASPYTEDADADIEFMCQKETDLHNSVGLCVNSTSNNYETSDCEVMNGYGNKMCESTIYSGGACSYDELTQKCLDTVQTRDTPLFTDCHEIYNNDLEKMEDKCNLYPKCNYKVAKDLDSNDIGVCYAKNKDDRHVNFCLSLTGLKNEDGSTPFSHKSGDESFDCHETTNDGFKYMNKTATDISHLKCEMFDNSNWEKDASGNTEKSEDSKTYSNSNANLKQMCNGLKYETGSNQCEFVEYHKNIPKEYNSKYDKITMCIPKGLGYLPNDVINKDNKTRCNLEGGFWDVINEMCIDPRGSCDKFKHNETCQLLDNCLWTTGTDDSRNENFEYGICKDISISLNKVDDLIDNIHEKHISSIIDLDLVEEKINKIVPHIQNVLSNL
jgi:hypothetical protein